MGRKEEGQEERGGRKGGWRVQEESSRVQRASGEGREDGRRQGPGGGQGKAVGSRVVHVGEKERLCPGRGALWAGSM